MLVQGNLMVEAIKGRELLFGSKWRRTPLRETEKHHTEMITTILTE